MALRVRQVSKSFASEAGPVPVLTGADLDMAPGDAVALTGPSGSGKSTLLHLLGALEKPDTGSIDLFGANPAHLAPDALADFRNRLSPTARRSPVFFPAVTGWRKGGSRPPEP